MAASGGLVSDPPPPPPTTTQEVFQWLKNLPLAPEYHPTLAEFQDPIAYIFKIEKEASKYGICKIVPPVSPASKKTAIANLNRSLAARAASSTSNSSPTFTTRQQQIGFCPRKPRPVQKPVWQSGENYTFQEFEAKAKAFERNYLKKCSKKGALSPLEIETLYWKATVDKPFSVEYANDMPGSAFSPKKNNGKEVVVGEGVTVGETEWNMREVSRAKGSLLRFMKEEIPGVTSPMIYIAMLFSWFAWHVEDHDLHSLNYLHMGAGKTWYGVPREAAVAFEEVVRVYGYGGEFNPLVTFAVLGEKTTVMSPEVFVNAGVPCCRLVQNAGEFVVTFPRAYHSGFSHGFNCGEASNIATPEWLRVAKEAAIRRASINYPPMVSHLQLLYDLAVELCTRMPMSINAKPRSSRLKDKQKGEGETLVKELFVNNVIRNNELLHSLGKGCPVVLLPRSSSDISACSNLRVGCQLRANPSLGLCSHKDFIRSSESSFSDNIMIDRNNGINQVRGIFSLKGEFSSLYERNKFHSLDRDENRDNMNTGTERQRLFSCVTCGILSFDCVAIIQPREAVARHLMSADFSFFNDWISGSAVSSDRIVISGQEANTFEENSLTRQTGKKMVESLYDVPVQSANYQIQTVDCRIDMASDTIAQREPSALGLLALNYGHSSDSENDQVEPDLTHNADEINTRDCSPNRYHCQNSVLSSFKQECRDGATADHIISPSRLDCGDDTRLLDYDGENGQRSANFKDRSNQTLDCSVDFENDNLALLEKNGLERRYRDPLSIGTTSNFSPVHDTQRTSLGRALVPIQDRDTMFAQISDEDSSRMHIFCLEHAVEVEQQLSPIGGVHISLLCHPEYPRIEAEAKLVSEELGIDYLWNETAFRDATKEDEERIQLALDSEEAIPGSGDWAVKLGINLFFSANLSWSSLYSKQMPYNCVIYNAFGRTSPATSPNLNVYGRRSGRQRKVVAGKWCGKVWMSNQVHPFLAKRDSEDQDQEQEQERSSHAWQMPDEKLERKPQSIRRNESTVSNRNAGKRRKVTAESRSFKKVNCLEVETSASDDSEEDNAHKQRARTHSSKQAKFVNGGASYDLLENEFHQQHRSNNAESVEREYSGSDDSSSGNFNPQYSRTLRSKVDKSIERDSAACHTLVEKNPLKQYRRIRKSKKDKYFEREDAVSDDSLEAYVHRWRVQGNTHVKVFERENAISDDSLEESSQQLHGRVPRSRQPKYIEKRDAVSDDSAENTSRQPNRMASRGNRARKESAVSDDSLEGSTYRQRFPRGKQAKFIGSEGAISDDLLEDNIRIYQRRIRRSKQAKLVERDDALSDDLLEENTHHRIGKTPRNKRAKIVEREDAVSDDSLGEHIHEQLRRVTTGKKGKFSNREDSVSDELEEEEIYRQSRKTSRGKQAKFAEREDAVSDDLLEDTSDQQHTRVLRNKQKKPLTLRQLKKQAPRNLKQGTSRLIKKETPQPIKQQRQMKQEAPRLWNEKNVNTAIKFDSQVEGEQEGGPSTRLRKRPSKPPKVTETKPKEKQQTSKKKVKNALAMKAPAGSKNVKMKDEEAEYQCDIEGCTMSFVSKQELAVHKRNICPVKGCGKKFFSHKYLVQHRRVHIDDRPLKCPWKGCKMTFKWAWARTEHIRVHTGARPYVCAEEGCGQTFRFVSDFSRHKRKTGHSVKKARR